MKIQFCAVQVEAGQHHAMMLMGRIKVVQAQLAQAQQARLRQLKQMQELQEEWAAIAGISPAGGLLSPYELSLLLNPPALEAHRHVVCTPPPPPSAGARWLVSPFMSPKAPGSSCFATPYSGHMNTPGRRCSTLDF